MHEYLVILPALSALLCLGLGVFTITRNPRHLANIAFAIGMLTLGVHEAGSILIMLAASSLAEAGVMISLAGQALMPFVWLLFSLSFARGDYKEILRKKLPVLIGVAAAALFFLSRLGSTGMVSLSPGGGSMDWRTFAPSHVFTVGALGRFFYIYFIIGAVLALIQLENTLRASTAEKRWRIKYVIFGVGAVLAFFIYSASQSLLFSTIKAEVLPLASAVILISSSIMAFFIVRHRLLDVDIFISRYVVYNSFTVLIVGVYLLAVGLIAQGLKYFNIPLHYFVTTLFIFVAILALVISLFTASIRRKFKLLINRHFYKHKYEFRDKWMESIEKIGSKRTVDGVASTLIEMLAVEMCSNRVSLYLYESKAQGYLAASQGKEPALNAIAVSHPFIAELKARQEPFALSDLYGEGKAIEPDVDRLFRDTGAVFSAPLTADNELIGFVLLGPDISGEPYIRDDSELLNALAAQSAIQIRNIRLAEELVTSREVEAFSRMSAFVMHDLKNLTNSLSLLSQNARHNMENPEFREDIVKTVDSTVSRMKRLIERLSAMPREMELKREPVEINSLIDRALKRLPRPPGKAVDISSGTGALPLIFVDPEAIEMVIINLVSNAFDAIKDSGAVNIKVSSDGQSVHVVISDNGSGMSGEYIRTALFQPFKTTKKNGLGIGLYQCKAVIAAHGGDISVESEAGKGTSFTLRFPGIRQDEPAAPSPL
ncbi:MAG: PEP-CTERM system histidine kinase PrsK [Deltaproteobacteria bacterium]|nr:PEP-CTERM system histidine kinase PrsK [Deltaproteobacteria bacterium]